MFLGGATCSAAAWSGQLVVIVLIVCATLVVILAGLGLLLVLVPDLRRWALRMRWGPPPDVGGATDPELPDERDDGG